MRNFLLLIVLLVAASGAQASVGITLPQQPRRIGWMQPAHRASDDASSAGYNRYCYTYPAPYYFWYGGSSVYLFSFRHTYHGWGGYYGY